MAPELDPGTGTSTGASAKIQWPRDTLALAPAALGPLFI